MVDYIRGREGAHDFGRVIHEGSIWCALPQPRNMTSEIIRLELYLIKLKNYNRAGLIDSAFEGGYPNLRIIDTMP